jgi:hypothetical protein
MALLKNTEITGSLRLSSYLNLPNQSPTPPGTGSVGLMWFEPSNNRLRFTLYNYTAAFCSWSAGGALSTGRSGLGGAGTQNAALAFGGFTTEVTNVTEEYDGSTWTGGGNLATARCSLGSAGTQNSALAVGSVCTFSCVEEYDGTSWSSGTQPNLLANTGRGAVFGGGVTDAVKAGGSTGSGKNAVITNCTEEYDGTIWTSGGNLSCARFCNGGLGTLNSGLTFVGKTFGGAGFNTTATEEYNGTSWSSGGNYLIGAEMLFTAAGTQNTGLVTTGTTYEYNGTSWSTGVSLTVTRVGGHAGDSSCAAVFGGSSSSTCTEEYVAGACCTPATCTIVTCTSSVVCRFK